MKFWFLGAFNIEGNEIVWLNKYVVSLQLKGTSALWGGYSTHWMAREEFSETTFLLIGMCKLISQGHEKQG